MRGYLKAVFVAVVVAGGVVGVTACGDSSDDGGGTVAASGGTTAASSSGASSPKGAPILLGSVASCSGPVASSIGGACPTLDAWAQSVNAKGGINGHPVKLTVIDDGGVPERSVAAVKQLVETDHVAALVGQASIVDATWQKYIEGSGVPVVGGQDTQSTYSTSPDFFPSGGQFEGFAYSYANVAKEAGKPKYGIIYCAEAPVCAQNPALLSTVMKEFVPSVHIVYTAKASATQPSYVAQCLAARNAGTQSLLVTAASDTTKRIVDQCAQQGYKPLIMVGGGVFNPTLYSDDAFDGAVNIMSNIPLSDTSLPATKELHAALDKYAPGISRTGPQWNGNISQAWAGGLLFEAAAKAGDIGPDSTPADVKKGLYRLKDETLGGFSSPLNFAAGKVTQVPCSFLEQIKDGKPTLPDGTKPTCMPATPEQYGDLLAGNRS